MENFSVFRERLAQTCHARDKTETEICHQAGFGGR
jgi:hypothetical protein